MNGECECGAIRFRVLVQPYHISRCQCSFCSKLMGEHGVVEYLFFKEQIIIEHGRPQKHLYEVPTTAKKLEVSFCANCGTKLFIEPKDHENCISVLSSPSLNNTLPEKYVTKTTANSEAAAYSDSAVRLYMGHRNINFNS